jgi:outer membrane protein
MCPRQAQPRPIRARGRWWRRGVCVAAALLLAALVAAPVGAQQPAQPPSRIGYVDMKRLLDNAPQVQAGRAALQREFAQRDAQLKAQEARLAELQLRQRRDSAILPKDAADALANEIDTLDRGIGRLRTKMRDDLAARQNEELNKRWPEIQDAVIEYARENGLDLVVASPVVYASASIDVTDAVLARLKRDFDARKPSP